MKAEITIYKPNGDPRMTAIVEIGSKRVFQLMEKDHILLKFTTATNAPLHLGDYVDIEGVGRYELTEPYKPEQDKRTLAYNHEIKLDAQYWKFKNKLMKFLPQIGTGETSWSYTDTLHNHAEQIRTNILALAYDKDINGNDVLRQGCASFLYRGMTGGEGDWRVVCDESVDSEKVSTQTYDGTNIIDAISAIAEAHECEWWFEENTLHFGKCQHGETPVQLNYGKEIIDISRKDSKEDYATRIYVYGSDRNVPSNYRKSLIFTADSVHGDRVRDTSRALLSAFFPEIMHTSNPLDHRTLAVCCSGSQNVSSGSSACESRFAWATAIAENLTAGFWDFNFMLGGSTVACPERIGTCNEIKAVLTLTFAHEDGSSTIKQFTSNSYIFSQSAKIAVANFGNSSIQIGKDAKTMTAELVLYALLGTNSSLKANFTCNLLMSYDNPFGIKGAQGVTINVIDTTTGEVSRTINDAIFNPDFEQFDGEILLTSGYIRAGEKFTIPSIIDAMVPAAYFTSKYAVLNKYADVITNGIVNSRLLLPECDGETPLNGYLDITTMESEDEEVEEVVIFEDIYPSRESTVMEVATDTYTDKQKEQDGSETSIQWLGFSIKDDLFNSENPLKSAYLIDGKSLQITFQTGKLAGLTFDAAYVDDMFEIQRDNDTLLPNDLIKPHVGDKYILSGFNIAMLNDESTNYIAAAESRLLAKAKEYAAKLNTDTQTYQCTIGCDYAKKVSQNAPDGLYLGIGRTVNLIHPAYFENGRISRVIGYEIPLDIPYDNPIYIIGEKAQYSRIGAIEEKLEGFEAKSGTLASVFGGTHSESGTTAAGGSPYIIAQVDNTPPTDKNIYSALRSRIEFAVKSIEQTIMHVWTFVRGLRIGNFIAGKTGAAIDEMGNAEVESLTVRSYMKVFELIYNRLNALEGNTSFADVGTIDMVEAGSGQQQVLTMRRRWDADITSFQPGDIIYGYINNLKGTNAGEANNIKAWAWVVGVDRVKNQLTVVPYPDGDTPAGVNHALTPNMVITRWGNNIEANYATYSNPEYQGVVIVKRGGEYHNIRQSSFFISCEDGNIVELMGVSAPTITAANYGTVIGRIPDGLLDEETEQLINKDQPYLFARGIIVQDLIRADYQGVVTKTANYRGAWSYTTACNEAQRYRNTPGTYDTVTHAGNLWQCVADGNTDEPSEETGSWVNMTGGREIPSLAVWQILPNADIITIRYAEDGDGAIRADIIPEAISCAIIKNSTEGDATYTDTDSLQSQGLKLWYSLDGTTWSEFVMGADEPLELEDGTDIIEAEDSTEENPVALTIGGDDVLATSISDRIYFELRSIPSEREEAEVKARAIIPVVKDGLNGNDGRDGANGVDGRDGLMVYPAGSFNSATRYSALGDTAPVVMYGENFFVLKRGCTYCGADFDGTNRENPATDVANGGSDARWQLLERFNAIFADIIMANFAKLASAVFYGDWMISQRGTLQTKTEYRYATSPEGSTPYMTDTARATRAPAGWFLNYPLSVGEGDAIFMISASINSDDSLRGLWSLPTVVTQETPNTLTQEQDSSDYQEFKSGSFEPYFAVNFLTGEARAKVLTFKEFIRPAETIITAQNFNLYTTHIITNEDGTLWKRILDAPKFTNKVTFDISMDDVFDDSMPTPDGKVAPLFYLPSRLTAGQNEYLDDYVGQRMRIINNTSRTIPFSGNSCDSENGSWTSTSIQPGCEVVLRCIFRYNEERDVKEIGWVREYMGKQ